MVADADAFAVTLMEVLHFFLVRGEQESLPVSVFVFSQLAKVEFKQIIVGGNYDFTINAAYISFYWSSFILRLGIMLSQSLRLLAGLWVLVYDIAAVMDFVIEIEGSIRIVTLIRFLLVLL